MISGKDLADRERTAKPSSNLVYIDQIKSQKQKEIQIKGVKCSCKKSWCPVCGKKTSVRRFAEKLTDWNWQYVRQIVFTVDPTLYENPEHAQKTITTEKHIANALRNLERTKGIKIIDWHWVLEWHRNGFPHWHVFILVDKKGKGGMIGGDNIRHYWKSGRATESFIRNENHWNRFVGYFEKHGYFDKKKAHQSRLPEWARNKSYVIRRTGGKASGNGKAKTNKYSDEFLEQEAKRNNPENEVLLDYQAADELGDWFLNQKERPPEETEGEKLDKCGCSTDIYLGFGFGQYIGRFDIPYKEFKKLNGEFCPGEGYFTELDMDQFNDLIPIIRGGHGITINELISVYEPKRANG